MEAKFYPTMEEAIWSFAKNHKPHQLYPHRIKAGEEIGAHYHKQANEWLCITAGEFMVFLKGVKCRFVLDPADPRQCLCLKLPKKIGHALIALTDLAYFVIRDRVDRTVYDRKEGKRDRKKNC